MQPGKMASNLSPTFKDNVFRHIEYLAGLGTRVTGTVSEAKAIEYIREQFQEIEIQVELEPFEFESYEITGLELKIGGKRYDPTLIGFNPYSGMSTFHGTITLMDPHTHDEAFEKSDLQDTVIVTTPRALDRSVPIPSGRRMYPLIRLNQIAHDHPNARARSSICCHRSTLRQAFQEPFEFFQLFLLDLFHGLLQFFNVIEPHLTVVMMTGLLKVP